MLERIPSQPPEQSQQVLSVIPAELPQEVKRLPAEITLILHRLRAVGWLRRD